MSHCGLKSPYLDLLPDEEKGKCSIGRYRPEFLEWKEWGKWSFWSPGY